jgi:hypothetical protein
LLAVAIGAVLAWLLERRRKGQSGQGANARSFLRRG